MNLRIAVIGGGIGGLTAAVALYQAGFEERFKTLRRGILAMEAEAEAERVASLHNRDVREQRKA